MNRSCNHLGVCQGRTPPCAMCLPKPAPSTEPQCFSVDDVRSGKPMPCAFCVPAQPSNRNPIDIDGPYTQRTDWAALRRSFVRQCRAAWRYIAGPAPW